MRKLQCYFLIENISSKNAKLHTNVVWYAYLHIHSVRNSHVKIQFCRGFQHNSFFKNHRKVLPSKHLPGQTQQCRHKKNVWNRLTIKITKTKKVEVNNKNTRNSKNTVVMQRQALRNPKGVGESWSPPEFCWSWPFQLKMILKR